MAATGVGAWTLNYRVGMTEPADDFGRKRVRWAVIALQQELIVARYLDADIAKLNGRLGAKSDAAIHRYQYDAGLHVDGIIGPKTARRLFHPLFVWWQAFYAIPANLLYGMARLESGMDPGAEGTVDSDDRGLMQYSRRWHPEVTDRQAYAEPRTVVPKAAEELADAYRSLGVESWSPAVASHNNPAKGRAWAEAGHAPDEQIERYVSLVRAAAEAPL